MTNIVRFIGDTHGKFNTMGIMMQQARKSIHVGDVGIGFTKYGDRNIFKKYDTISGDHTFIRGNHDKLFNIKHHFKDYWNKDGSYDADNDIFFVGGAWSIDKRYRTENVDWWKDEEIHEGLFDRILSSYSIIKPSIVVSHDIPKHITPYLYKFGYYDTIYSNTTNVYLERMFYAHQPKLWICGHWHDKSVKNVLGTDFVVVGMDSCIDIDLDKYTS